MSGPPFVFRPAQPQVSVDGSILGVGDGPATPSFRRSNER
jgi:hypothetical protein